MKSFLINFSKVIILPYIEIYGKELQFPYFYPCEWDSHHISYTALKEK